MYICTPGGKRRPLDQDLTELVARLMPVAREIGDDAYLNFLQPVSGFETGASWQRRIYRESGNWKALMNQMSTRLALELDGDHDAKDKSETHREAPTTRAAPRYENGRKNEWPIEVHVGDSI
jgi:hypothetical protein